MTPLNNVLREFFCSLGLRVGTQPWHVVSISVLVALLMATGLQNMSFVSDLEYLFVPTGSRGLSERLVVSELFDSNNEADYYVPGHESAVPKALQVYIVTEHSDLLTVPNWSSVVAVHDYITTLRVRVEGLSLNYSLIGATVSQDVNEFVHVLHSFMEQVEKKRLLSYPLMTNPLHFNTWFMPQSFADLQLDDLGHILRAGVVKLTYHLDPSLITASRQWEEAVQSSNFSAVLPSNSNLSVHVLTSTSLQSELSNNINSSLVLFPFALLFIVAFTLCSTRSVLGLLGLMTSGLATLASWGLLIYVSKQPWQAINLAAIFVLLGVGLDDTFVLITAWNKHAHLDCVKQRLAATYGDAGPSITLTSLTNVVSVAIGFLMPGFRAVQLFCLYVGVAFLLLFVYTFACFGPLIVVFEKCRNNGTEIESTSQQRSNSSDNRGSNGKTQRQTVWLKLAMFVSRPLTKLLVMLLYILYLATSLYLMATHLQEGLERRNLSRDQAYVTTAMEVEDRFFRDYPYRIQIVLENKESTEWDYSQLSTQQHIQNILTAFRSSQYIVSDKRDLEESWLDDFLLNLELSGIIQLDETSFNAELKSFLDSSSLLRDNVVFNSNMSKVIASRFVLQTTAIRDARAEVDMVKELRSIADEHNVTVYHYFFPFFDQFIDVRPLSITTVGVCCMVTLLVSLLFLYPCLVSTLVVSLIVLSIETGVVGLMAFMEVRLDVVTLISLVVCVGLSVDFAAHVALHFVNDDYEMKNGQPNEDSNNKMCDGINVDPRIFGSLVSFGPPIMEAAISTLLAIGLLIIQPSYILRSFAKMMLLVVVLSVLHALVILPIILSLLLPIQHEKDKKKDSEEMENMVNMEQQ